MENDFREFGKKMPYQVPEGFFEEIEGRIIGNINVAASRKRSVRLWSAGAVAAGLLTGFAILWWSYGGLADSVLQETDCLYSYNPEMDDVEVEEIVDLIESDIFLALDIE